MNSTDLDTDTEPLERSLEQGVLLAQKSHQFGVDKRGELDLFLAELREELDHVRSAVLCGISERKRERKGERIVHRRQTEMALRVAMSGQPGVNVAHAR